MVNSQKIRLAGMASIAGGLIQVLLGIALLFGADPEVLPLPQIAFTLSVWLLLGGVLGMLWLKVLGRGKWLLIIPSLGIVSYTIAHVMIFLTWNNSVDQPFSPLGALFMAVGMLACGIAAIRAKVWKGWKRFSPLLVGVYFFVGPLPAVIVTEQPNYTLLMLWGLFWANVGYSIVSSASSMKISD